MLLSIIDGIGSKGDVRLLTIIVVTSNLVSLVLFINVSRKGIYQILNTSNRSVAISQISLSELRLDAIKDILQVINILQGCCMSILLLLHISHLVTYQGFDGTLCFLNAIHARNSLIARRSCLIILLVVILGSHNDTILFIEFCNDIILPILVISRWQLSDSLRQLSVVRSLSFIVSIHNGSMSSIVILKRSLKFFQLGFTFHNFVDFASSSIYLGRNSQLVSHDILLSQVVAIDLGQNCRNIESLQSSFLLRTDLLEIWLASNGIFRIIQCLQRII